MKGLVQAEDDRLSLRTLLHCRTVVEKQQFVSTGIMTQVEGELFEIELSEFNLFELGEPVKLTVYSPAGIQSFQSIVFAKYEGAIAVIQPPVLSHKFSEKREHTRVEASGTAFITSVSHGGEGNRTLSQPIELVVKDISLGGIGLIGIETEELSRATGLGAVVELGFSFDCELELVRRSKVEDVVFWGMRMKLRNESMQRPLRAYVLRQQVQAYIKQRTETERKKR